MGCAANEGNPPHTALPAALFLVCTLCDDHSRSPFTHSWDLLGKVVQLGVHEGSLYHEHEHMYHQLMPAGSRRGLLRFPRGLLKRTNMCVRLLQFRICRRWKRLLRPPHSLPRQRVARAREKNGHTPAASYVKMIGKKQAKKQQNKRKKQHGFDNDGLTLQHSFIRLTETKAPC